MKVILLSLTLVFISPLTRADNLPAAGFELLDSGGNTVSLPRNHTGVDIYLFWASWCPYCKALMPHLQSMKIEYGDALTVYALNIRDDEDPRVFMQEKAYDFTLLPGADPVMRLYGVYATPALFVVDGDGFIRFNLYEAMTNHQHDSGKMSHRKRAARKAPAWAAEIRQSIDMVLDEHPTKTVEQ